MASRFGNEWSYYGGGAEVTQRRNNKGPLLRTPGNVLCSVDVARGAKTSTCVRGWMARGVRAGPRRNTITTRP